MGRGYPMPHQSRGRRPNAQHKKRGGVMSRQPRKKYSSEEDAHSAERFYYNQ